MPYESVAQRGLFHSPNSPVSKAEVKKWDKESKGQTGLPYHVKKKAKGGRISFAAKLAQDQHFQSRLAPFKKR